jgi:hypothetical protein
MLVEGMGKKGIRTKEGEYIMCIYEIFIMKSLTFLFCTICVINKRECYKR